MMRLAGLMTVLILCWAFTAQAATLNDQRKLFDQARQALDDRHFKTFKRLKAKLDGYPLTPYLDIWHARRMLKKGDDRNVASILEQHADVPEVINLRVKWISFLTKRRQWQKVVELFAKYPSDIKRLPETYMAANWYTGNQQLALKLFSQRWVVGKRNSRFSQPIEQSWLKKGHPTTVERWNRIAKLAHKGQWQSINNVSRKLSKQQRQWVRFWKNAQKRPAKYMQQWPQGIDAEVASLILKEVLKRQSRKDVEKAWELLQTTVDADVAIDAAAVAENRRSIALLAAKRHHPSATIWLEKLPESFHNEETRSWLTRSHLINRNWHMVLQTIMAMPVEEQQEVQWIYWKARALAMNGNTLEAAIYYRKLASDRGYYSFLAAEKLDLPYTMNNADIRVSDELLSSLSSLPAIQRTYEWLQRGKMTKASREWNFALQGATPERWKAAAVIATSWQWHDHIIRSAYKAGEMDALDQRFPLAFEKEVKQSSRETGLNPSEIWSIIRQESAFNRHARSYVGASGLMQLMPATARQVARSLNIKSKAPNLFSARTNIRLGSSYLAKMKKRFGSLALAAAAYNAGPHRVSRWLKSNDFSSPEAWVESIPYNETRRYVKQVMAFVTVYEWRQSKPMTSLALRLNRPVQKLSFNRRLPSQM